MIHDTINQIEERLRSSGCLTPEQRRELEGLLAQLRAEAQNLPRQPEPASTRSEDDLLGRLKESVTEFETTHPQLITLVDRINNMLASFGI
ncbi:MAG: DUF4404 family protein [Verrucomicrobiota bacterium]